MPNNSQDMEREQVEQVFGLTGGELSDKPWECFAVFQNLDNTSKVKTRRRYWFEGVPEYARSDFRRGCNYRTVCRIDNGFVSYPPSVLIDYEDGSEWELVKSYSNSGEAECPLKDTEDEASEGCPLCEALKGEEHGYVYLGDGCAELVYQQKNVENSEN